MDNLLEQYRHFAMAHGVSTLEGDSNAANVAHDNLFELAARLVNAPNCVALLTLLDDDELWVQLWSATHSLEIDEHRATSKLQQLANAGIPLTSITARLTLQSWQNGELIKLRE